MAGRLVAKSTKLSDAEFDALLRAIDAKGGTVSTYIADSVAERLVREGFLAQHVAEPDETRVECLHPSSARRSFSWGAKCDEGRGGCGQVLTGKHAR